GNRARPPAGLAPRELVNIQVGSLRADDVRWTSGLVGLADRAGGGRGAGSGRCARGAGPPSARWRHCRPRRLAASPRQGRRSMTRLMRASEIEKRPVVTMAGEDVAQIKD